jgi:hypothetical protein
MSQDSRQQEALSKLRTYRKPLHADFGWWKEREEVDGLSYYSLRPTGSGKPTTPPQELLRTLDRFESLVDWLETKPIGQEMTAYEKAQVALKLLDATSTNSLSVDLENDSFDVNVNLKGNPEYPITAQVEGLNAANPILIEKSDS